MPLIGNDDSDEFVDRLVLDFLETAPLLFLTSVLMNEARLSASAAYFS